MKFKFKIQDFQTDAVNSVVNVFAGQPYINRVKYTRDLGIRKKIKQTSLLDRNQQLLTEDEIAASYMAKGIENNDGFENAEIILKDDELLHNIREIQSENNIKLSENLVKHLGRCSLDIEMETGTGKTYVYIKTLFELNRQYGFSKFIIVVPSIAIREGAKKTFDMTQEHFMENYKKKARFFIYNSKNLNELDDFSSSGQVNVMIINAQAFNARGVDARRIYEKLDEFQTRKPINVIAANRPIVILDEPQKLGGKATQESLKLFNPLFCLSYSATHAKQNNLVYVLDALDAYNKRIVKKIEVKGFEIKNFRGTDKYLYLDNIIISSKKPPKAKIELEIRYNKSINKVDSATKRNSTESDDISAYELILKNKERLLSFEEPTRFIFSHSALREGWDNPNVCSNIIFSNNVTFSFTI